MVLLKKPQDPLSAYNYNTLQLEKKTPVAGSFGISGGDSYNIGENGKLNFFATGAFGNEYMSTKDGKSYGDINGEGVINKKYDQYDSDVYATNTTAMGNIGYKINSNNKINFNSLFINTTNQETEEYRGYAADFAENGNGFVRRNTYTETKLYINQLLGEHKFGDRYKLNWAASRNLVKDKMPDRTSNKMNQVEGGYLINSQSAPNNNRYFQDLTENETAALVSLDYKFAKTEEEDYNGKLTLGYNGRLKERDFEATQYNFKTTTDPVSHAGDIVNPDNLDLFYNQQNFTNDFFRISTFRGGPELTNALDPQTYNGKLTIHAAFASVEYKFGPKFTGVVGMRAEQITQDMDWNTQLGDVGSSTLEKTAFLPNLTLKYALNDKQNLRLGFSKTYTLPQFKETVPFVYEEITQAFIGNEDLYESDNYNLDIKWEMFPKAEEVISFTAFGKYIQNPMNEVTIASSTNDISYVNTGDKGYAIGGEVEYRKLLFATEEENSKKLTAGVNASYLHTNQDLDKQKVKDENKFEADFTHTKSRFTGASDWLVNADISFFNEWNNKESNLTTTLSYNFFSDRIYSIGTSERGDLVDKAVGTLDFIVKSQLTKKIGLGLSAKNLLDPKIERVQENAGGDVLSQTYKKGMGISLSVNYQF